MKTYKIAAIPGNGIGAEVIAAGVEVLEMLVKQDGSFELRFEHFDWGSAYYLRHTEMMPVDGLARLKNFDAIYFGAVGSAVFHRCSSRSTARLSTSSAKASPIRSGHSGPR